MSTGALGRMAMDSKYFVEKCEMSRRLSFSLRASFLVEKCPRPL